QDHAAFFVVEIPRRAGSAGSARTFAVAPGVVRRIRQDADRSADRTVAGISALPCARRRGAVSGQSLRRGKLRFPPAQATRPEGNGTALETRARSDQRAQ